MVAGIVLFALGLKTTLSNVDGSLPSITALGLCGGVALYLLAHVALRLRIGGGWGHGRPVAAILLIGLLPLAGGMQALSALGLVAAVCATLIAYEAIRYRESRAWIAVDAARLPWKRRPGSQDPAGGPVVRHHDPYARGTVAEPSSTCGGHLRKRPKDSGKNELFCVESFSLSDDGSRTRDPHLGKVAR